jgi:hypothetical protein
VRLTGKRLKIIGPSDIVSIVLGKPSGWLYYVDLNELYVNKPGELMFRLPAMQPGEYNILVTTLYGGGKMLKTPHTGLYDKLLTVVFPPAGADRGQGTAQGADAVAADGQASASANKPTARKRGTKGSATAR